MDDIEKRYGKLFTGFLKSILDGEITDWDGILGRLKAIG